uniref:Tudor domain-containing protein n=1 Tax=Trypanosoma congolense (strain IL3000) TaxID=1068625 RepID=G0UXK0_TRYCI|nr:conserved hypothetical protein [Trypanosoma congolense IL3000]
MQERERLLEEYYGLLANLEEALELKQNNRTDEEVDGLIDEAKAELRTVVGSLNASEVIEVTEGVTKAVDSDGNAVVLYGSVAPYEVHFDNVAWYSCVIVDIIKPETPLDRIRYKAWILGYNVEEEVYSDALRAWQPQTTEGESTLRSGVACHAISPRTGKFVPAKVVRLTLSDTVIVTFNTSVEKTTEASEENEASALNKPASESNAATNDELATVTEEIPLSHVRAGRFYAQLRKRPVLTPEERALRRAQNTERKRVRLEAKRQLEANLASQNANDWQRLVTDMGFGGGPTKKRR